MQVLLVFHLVPDDGVGPRPIWVGPKDQMDGVVKQYLKRRTVSGGGIAVHDVDEGGYVLVGSGMIPITEELLREARN